MVEKPVVHPVRVLMECWRWERSHAQNWSYPKDAETARPHLSDDHGRRWLLDGSGECA